jgi:hypothetical protein
MPRLLTNDFIDFHLIDLGYNTHGHGPFILRQEGMAPNSPDLYDDRFLLRRDGTWVINLTFFQLSEADQQAFVFKDIPEVWATVEALPGTPVIEAHLPPGKSRAELLAGAQATMSRVMLHVHQAEGSRLTR